MLTDTAFCCQLWVLIPYVSIALSRKFQRLLNHYNNITVNSTTIVQLFIKQEQPDQQNTNSESSKYTKTPRWRLP